MASRGILKSSRQHNAFREAELRRYHAKNSNLRANLQKLGRSFDAGIRSRSSSYSSATSGASDSESSVEVIVVATKKDSRIPKQEQIPVDLLEEKNTEEQNEPEPELNVSILSPLSPVYQITGDTFDFEDEYVVHVFDHTFLTKEEKQFMERDMNDVGHKEKEYFSDNEQKDIDSDLPETTEKNQDLDGTDYFSALRQKFASDFGENEAVKEIPIVSFQERRVPNVDLAIATSDDDNSFGENTVNDVQERKNIEKANDEPYFTSSTSTHKELFSSGFASSYNSEGSQKTKSSFRQKVFSSLKIRSKR